MSTEQCEIESPSIAYQLWKCDHCHRVAVTPLHETPWLWSKIAIPKTGHWEGVHPVCWYDICNLCLNEVHDWINNNWIKQVTV